MLTRDERETLEEARNTMAPWGPEAVRDLVDIVERLIDPSMGGQVERILKKHNSLDYQVTKLDHAMGPIEGRQAHDQRGILLAGVLTRDARISELETAWTGGRCVICHTPVVPDIDEGPRDHCQDCEKEAGP